MSTEIRKAPARYADKPKQHTAQDRARVIISARFRSALTGAAVIWELVLYAGSQVWKARNQHTGVHMLQFGEQMYWGTAKHAQEEATRRLDRFGLYPISQWEVTKREDAA